MTHAERQSLSTAHLTDPEHGTGIPPDGLLVIPVRNTVIFPGMIAPLSIGRSRSTRALKEALDGSRPLGLLMQRDPTLDEPAAIDLHRIGTLVQVLQHTSTQDGGYRIVVRATARFRVEQFVAEQPCFVARVETIRETTAMATEREAFAGYLKNEAIELLGMVDNAPLGMDLLLRTADDLSVVTDLVATILDIKPPERQEVLETLDVDARARRVGELLSRALELSRMSKRIRDSAHESMSKAQREFYLREQQRAIQKELGDDTDGDTDALSARIDAAGMPAAVEGEARKELKRLAGLPSGSAETGIIRTYLDWLVDLPWSKSSPDEIDLARARRVLDEDHHGLEKIKTRILEFLAVRKLNPQGKSPILCFVGPPGVGKTSLGRSIARAMGREYGRVSLGGVHDEAEIRGHRRTYVGALPGNIIQGLKKCGVNNPVFVLDEIDKLGRGIQGDPSSALLEVLDPEQNSTFRDNYLGLPFDLSRVMFIATANVEDAIPAPLRDRCEIIRLSGYTEEEKLQIATRYLVPRQRAENGIREGQLDITTEALRQMVRRYTREAGCRNLEREIGSVARHAAVRIAEGRVERRVVEAADLREVLGRPRFESTAAQRTSIPGVATGLSWTPFGGEILFVEAGWSPGRGKLILTGQLGDVMRESAQAALTLVKQHALDLGLDPSLFQERDIHIHVPAGAIPKDGPSAGVTLYTALVSLLSGRTVKSDLAMTGEVSLRGLVLPVGGIKEKVLAAHHAGIKTVVLPGRNVDDLEDLPEDLRHEVRFVPVEHVRELLDVAFDAPPAGPSSPTPDLLAVGMG